MSAATLRLPQLKLYQSPRARCSLLAFALLLPLPLRRLRRLARARCLLLLRLLLLAAALRLRLAQLDWRQRAIPIVPRR